MRRRLPLLGVLTLAAACVGATPARANTSIATIACEGVTFNYADFPTTGTNSAQETVYIDDIATPAADKTVTFSGQANASDTITLNLSGDHTVLVNVSTSSADGPGGAYTYRSLSCGSPPAPTCTSGTGANFRWHYSANGTSGSWSGTKTQLCGSAFSMGPQAMEGDLKLAPGTTMLAGYDLTVPGNKASLSFTVTNPQVVFQLRCVSGATPSPSTMTVTMPTQAFTITNAAWYPSGDQHNSLVYQGSTTVPDACDGGQVRFNQGGTFSGTLN